MTGRTGKWGWSIWDEYQDDEFVMTNDGKGFDTAEAAKAQANTEWNFTREQAELEPEELKWDDENRVARTTYPSWTYGVSPELRENLSVVIRYFRFGD